MEFLASFFIIFLNSRAKCDTDMKFGSDTNTCRGNLLSFDVYSDVTPSCLFFSVFVVFCNILKYLIFFFNNKLRGIHGIVTEEGISSQVFLL